MLTLLSTLRKTFTHKNNTQNIPYLKQFIKSQFNGQNDLVIQQSTNKPTYYIQTYGCQMNINDTQIIRSVLKQKYQQIYEPNAANVILLNTCAIRQAAQQKIYQRIRQTSKKSIVGVLGCMAERLKQNLFKQGVKVVCGPDAYRDLPRLINLAIDEDSTQMNVQLSAQQTYADLSPVRRDPNSPTAYISIMRGCNNMCSFCIVPFVRGRQRSRHLGTILKQIQGLESQGVKQIIFLGQNVNSYHDLTTPSNTPHLNSQGFKQMFKIRHAQGARFADLLDIAAQNFPNIRFRFTSPHPKDFPQPLLEVIKNRYNVCKQIHLPVQSGSSIILQKMRRNHTREAYLQLVKKIKQKIPNIALSTDVIAGFCGQTEQNFQDTLNLLRQVKFDMAFLFAYSMRQKTHAHRNYVDDIPKQQKLKRLKLMIDQFTMLQSTLNNAEIDKLHLLLLQGNAKRQQNTLMGKTDTFKNGYVKKQRLKVLRNGQYIDQREIKIGDYVAVRVQSVGPRALYCKPIAIAFSLSDFYHNNEKYVNLMDKQKQQFSN